MKKIILLLILMPFILKSQESADLNSIAIYVNVPKSLDGLNENQLLKIRSRVESILSSNGISGEGYSNSFAITPNFLIYEEKKVEGLQNLTVIDAEVDLHIKNMINGVIYSSYSIRVTGSGKSKDQAITNAVRNIPLKNKDISEFIGKAKQEIILYYQSKCDEILMKADSYLKNNQYNTAIAVLMQIPAEAGDCYNQSITKANEIYGTMKNNICQQKIIQAKAYQAANKFNEALNVLSQIDPTSNCFSEVPSLLNSLETQVDKKELETFQRNQALYKDQLELKKLQLKTMKELALAEYNSRPKEIHYHSLFGF